MNKKKLVQLGVPHDHVPLAIAGIQAAATRGREDFKAKRFLPQLIAQPDLFVRDEDFGDLARAMVADLLNAETPREVRHATWGAGLDAGSIQQIETACQLPVARAAALMPDAHMGYGLPIGGVLACENAVVPYAVGVDIACRMRLTITDLPAEPLVENERIECERFDQALEKGTLFGAGGRWNSPRDHDVLDEDWTITAVTREVRDRAVGQLGTSGSGNHFVEWGVLELPEPEFGLQPGRYVALLSHSGSRGAGARVCQRYSDLARQAIPHRYREDKHLRHLAWLSLDDERGQEYWAAMELMGRYAAANHEVIHQTVLGLAGGESLAVIENHHNFAWKERHGDQELVVHRKGATPASAGELGVIPGTMSDTAYVVQGKGEATSLRSASHGAGRRMSRTEARRQFNWKMWQQHLKERRVRLLAGGIDEVPGEPTRTSTRSCPNRSRWWRRSHRSIHASS
ncbi:MAG: RtcB family protein [Pirellulaceae bacterium]